jgi:pimeloyl-ACP methyl ester carboxylesterase
MQPFIPNLKVKKLPTGHWPQLEKADELNAILEEFIQGVGV